MKYLVPPFKAKNEGGYTWIKKGVDEKWTRFWTTDADRISFVSQRFGKNAIPLYAELGMQGHNGTDWAIPNRTCIYAVHDGEIVELRTAGSGYGAFIRLRYTHDGHKEEYVYGHLEKPLVHVGQKVRVHDLIALSDNTGASTGPHLHSGRRFLNDNGTVKDYDNGYFGYTDEYENYYETDIPNTTELKTLKEYIENNSIWPWRKKNWLMAQKMLGISGHTRMQYYRYLLKH